jgi:hypothetical protein
MRTPQLSARVELCDACLQRTERRGFAEPHLQEDGHAYRVHGRTSVDDRPQPRTCGGLGTDQHRQSSGASCAAHT